MRVADAGEVEVALEPGDVGAVEVMPDDDVGLCDERVDGFEEDATTARLS